MYDLLPTAVVLLLAAWVVRHNDGHPVIQIYVAIVVSYLNIFPALDYLFSSGEGMESFARFQLLIIGFFELPLLALLNRRNRHPQAQVPPSLPSRRLRLSVWLPLILGALLLVFWSVSLQFDMFLVRLAYVGPQQGSPDIPTPLLYLYRATVETSFFVVIFLSYTLRLATKQTPNYGLYKWLLVAYIATFFLFFGANSRMQFLLLVLCLLGTQAKVDTSSLRRWKLALVPVFAGILLLGLTLLRELYIEQNERLEMGDLAQLLHSVGWLIAARLDSVVMLNPLVGTGFHPFGFQWSGVLHVLKFNMAFFTDPSTYAEIKNSEVTSPSVEIVNRLLSASEVDFPKSMILDMFLSFGVCGLLATAAFLGRVMSRIQEQILNFRHFTMAFLTAIYVLPMLLQFEKEFLGFLFSFVKWTPFLILIICLRPREFRAARPPAAAAPDGKPPVESAALA
jgi:hypothetical protein